MSFKNLMKFVEKNGPSIATAGSMILTAAAVFFAIKKAPETNEIIQEHKNQEEPENPQDKTKSTVHYVSDIVMANKEAVACGFGAMACVYASNKMNGRTIASLAGALALSDDKLKKVYKAAEKKFGSEKANDLRKDAANEPGDKTPFEMNEKTDTRWKNKDTRPMEQFYDTFSETLFECSNEQMENSLMIGKKRFGKDRELSFNKWRSIMGLPDSDLVGVYSFTKRAPFQPILERGLYQGVECTFIMYEYDPEKIM